MGNDAKARLAKGYNRSTRTFEDFTVPLRPFRHETFSQCSIPLTVLCIRMLGSLFAHVDSELGAPRVLPAALIAPASVCCMGMSWSLLAGTTYAIRKRGASLWVLRSPRMLTISIFPPRHQLSPFIMIVIANILPHDVCATPSVR